MKQVLTRNQVVQSTTSGLSCTVGDYLGGGGQGEVYQADFAGQAVALKWYYPHAATAEQRTALELLIKLGAPNDRFLWPMDLVSGEGIAGFGYIMPLRPAQYNGLVDIMKRRIEPSFRALTTAGLELADSFLQLHSKGLCYRDISFGNVFIEPDTGAILICDNDNVGIDLAVSGGTLGTPRFMAPEIVRGEALPGTATDLFSLAVLLFYLFMVHHPLEGQRETQVQCFDMATMTRLYGTEPLFIFDPDNTDNAPVPGKHDNALAFWPIYPLFLQKQFIRAFTKGLGDPYGRVRESEWRKAMARLRDSIATCPYCGAECFLDLERSDKSVVESVSCWGCERSFPTPPSIRVGKQDIVLTPGTALYPHHVDPRRLCDFGKPIATVERHPNDPGVWGLKNLSNTPWSRTTIRGSVKEVQPGQSVRLDRGTKIRFGKTEGEIRT